MRLLIVTISVLMVFRIPAAASESGGLSGTVEDSQGHVLPDAEVMVQSESTGARWRTRADGEGRYSVSGVPPGRYKVTARMPGFRTASRVGAVLDSAEGLSIDFSMELLGLHEVITVTTGHDAMSPSTTSSLLLSRDSPGATLPVNGGDYRVLFDLMPGVVITPAASSDAGQFTSAGQRPNSNTFRVDGISANTGVGASILPGAFPGASLPAMTAIGSTENLVSNETAQSVELRTSDFSSEFSGRAGARSLVNTRSGTNAFHEELFGHLRDNGWNARDWFANSRGLEFPRPSYYRLGAVFGGPIRHNRTFYFFSAERTMLTDTAIQLTSVPSLEARQNASGNQKQILNWYPWPIGPDLGHRAAEGLVTSDASGELLTTSLRIDHSLGSKGNLFVRLMESPTRSQRMNRFNWASGTLGLTVGGSHAGIHDLRVNYSRANLLMSNFGGGPLYGEAVLALVGLLPVTVSPDDGIVLYQPIWTTDLISVLPRLSVPQTLLGLSVPGLGQFISYGSGEAQQDQLELREAFSKTIGRHDFRAGIDYIRLQPSRSMGAYTVLGVASSLESLLAGNPLAVTSSSLPQTGGRIHEISLFAQDTFRVNDSLSLLYGVSWEITPPTASAGMIPTVSGLWTGTEWQNAHSGDINGTAPWPMRYGQFAPRIGLAYRFPAALVVRAAAGAFRDATLGAAVNPINGAPFNSWMLAAGGTGFGQSTGSSGGTTSGPAETSPDVQRFLLGSYPALRLPTSYQWRLAVERNVGSRGAGSIAYTGAAGRNLLGHQAYVDPDTGILERLVTLTENSSNYQALQLRYSGSLAQKLYGSVSYTWAHSIDDGSQDSSVFLIHPQYRLREARASSSYDVRHALTAALSYPIAPTVAGVRLAPWLAGWTLSMIGRARGGFPIDVLSSDQPLGRGFDNVGRPDRVPGVPVWIADPSVPGHSRLNPAAFSVPTAGATGTLGRNAVPGRSMAQIDMSLRREFGLIRGISAEIGLNVFNVLNHPAFADPVSSLTSPWFGQSTSMQNLMFGSGSPNTGLPPLFQTGGPRSAEFTFRLSF